MNHRKQFTDKAFLLLAHIYNLQTKGKRKSCFATTQTLARMISTSQRQTTRYLKYLREMKLIDWLTTPPYSKGRDKGCRQDRVIEVLCTKPEGSDQVLAISFDKRINNDLKAKLINDIVLSNKKIPDLLEKYTPEPNSELENIIYTNVDADAPLDVEIPAGFKEKFMFFGNGIDKERLERQEEERKLYEEYRALERAEEQEAAFNKTRNKEAEKLIGIYHDGSYPLQGQNSIERLAFLSITEYKKLGLPTEAELALLAQNTKYENGTYITTIYLGGQIPYQLPLLDYVPWGQDSSTYRDFEKIFKGE